MHLLLWMLSLASFSFSVASLEAGERKATIVATESTSRSMPEAPTFPAGADYSNVGSSANAPSPRVEVSGKSQETKHHLAVLRSNSEVRTPQSAGNRVVVVDSKTKPTKRTTEHSFNNQQCADHATQVETVKVGFRSPWMSTPIVLKSTPEW